MSFLSGAHQLDVQDSTFTNVQGSQYTTYNDYQHPIGSHNSHSRIVTSYSHNVNSNLHNSNNTYSNNSNSFNGLVSPWTQHYESYEHSFPSMDYGLSWEAHRSDSPSSLHFQQPPPSYSSRNPFYNSQSFDGMRPETPKSRQSKRSVHLCGPLRAMQNRIGRFFRGHRV